MPAPRRPPPPPPWPWAPPPPCSSRPLRPKTSVRKRDSGAVISRNEWRAYFDRILPDAPLEERIASYERHMKYGPVRDYWSEFVFEAYLNHRTEVIMLAGLPDVAESRPHARFNSR